MKSTFYVAAFILAGTVENKKLVLDCIEDRASIEEREADKVNAQSFALAKDLEPKTDGVLMLVFPSKDIPKEIELPAA